MPDFELVSKYEPAGDQPTAIKELVDGLNNGDKHQILLGVTGSGKTFTISNVIAQVKKPTLVISHNKTLAAQLYSELKAFFPNNAVEFFISYYDYYQPEAYIAKTDTYIEKDFAINDEIDRLRLRTTSSLVDDRRDVIVVASVSCIYGIGTRQDFVDGIMKIKTGMKISRKNMLLRLQSMYFTRNDFEFTRGSYRVRGDTIDVIPAYEDLRAIRIEMFGDEIDKIYYINALTGETFEEVASATVFPAKIFVTSEAQLSIAMTKIRDELYDRLKELRDANKLVEAQRLEQRTLFDLEMMKEVGYCSGIENYSMHLAGREFGDRPNCLFDYFPEDFLLVVDESHVSIPQIRAMYNGDRVRKTNLVDFGFRLPSALENRPLKFEEYEKMTNQIVYMSATPADYELEKTGGAIVEQVIRPTGLLDPEISVRPVKSQIDDLLKEIRDRTKKKERVLVTTLTKRMAEDLSEYFQTLSVKVAYIHSDVDTLSRIEIIRSLRIGEFDVLVGVNLLREGLDLPEVSLVAILDADKEGFLRSERSLLQLAGRAARNSDGMVIFYADRVTNSMEKVINETNRRRALQIAYNKEHHINPKTIYKSLAEIMSSTGVADMNAAKNKRKDDAASAKFMKIAEPMAKFLNKDKKNELMDELYKEMKKAAGDLDFERAARLRDEIASMKNS